MASNGLQVVVRSNTAESVKEASRTIIQKISIEGVVRELRERKYFIPASLKKKKKREEARRKMTKQRRMDAKMGF